MNNRKHLERQLLQHLHHVLTGPKGPEHAAMILGGLVVLWIAASIFSSRASQS